MDSITKVAIIALSVVAALFIILDILIFLRYAKRHADEWSLALLAAVFVVAPIAIIYGMSLFFLMIVNN